MNGSFRRIAILCASVAVSALANAQGVKAEFDLPAQGLAESLKAVATATHTNVLFDTAEIEAYKAPAIKGSISIEEALSRMLDGTGLTYKFLDKKTIVLALTGAKTSAVSPDLQVSSPHYGEGGEIQELTVAQRDSSPYSSPARMPQGVTYAASEEADKEKLDEIVVTGTNIRGANPAGAHIISISRKEIDQSGFSTVPELLRSIPQNFGGGVGDNLISNRATAGTFNSNRSASINLRGLGVGSTLTLLNGHRLAPSNSGEFIDINSLPLSAIERVEILADGSSAIYGSDAIAGVVNVILRKDFNGLETAAQGRFGSQGDYDDQNISQLAGKAWETGSVLAGYELAKNSALFAGDRSFTANLDPQAPLRFPSEKHSAFVHMESRIGSEASLYTDLIYSHRVSDTIGNSPYTRQNQRARTKGDAYAITLGGHIQLPYDWRLNLSGNYAVDATRSDTVAPQPLLYDGKSTIAEGSARVEGKVLTLPGGNVRAAFGVSHLRSKTAFDGFVPGFAFPISQGTRNVSSAYSEVLIPIVNDQNAIPAVRRLEFNVASRYDHYSDFGATTNPKISALWNPIDEITVRGSWGTSFKAPNFIDLGSTTEIILDLTADPLSTQPDGRSTVLVQYGLAKLKPEQAKSWTVGVDFQSTHIPELTLSATYYNINLEDRIARPALGFIDIFNDIELYDSFIQRTPSQADIAAIISSDTDGAITDFSQFRPGGPTTLDDIEVIVDFSLQNLARTDTKGLDFLVKYAWVTVQDRVTLALNANHVLENSNRVLPDSPIEDDINRTYAPVSLTGNISATWDRGPFSATLTTRHTRGHTDSYAVSRGFAPRKVSSLTTVDMMLAIFGDKTTAFKHVDLSLSVLNLFDRDPPLAYSQFANADPDYDDTKASPLGRVVGIGFRKRW